MSWFGFYDKGIRLFLPIRERSPDERAHQKACEVDGLCNAWQTPVTTHQFKLERNKPGIHWIGKNGIGSVMFVSVSAGLLGPRWDDLYVIMSAFPVCLAV